MSYTYKRTTIRLVFDDPDMKGLEIVCRSLPLGEYFELARLKDDVSTEAAQKLMVGFAETVLESWNMREEDGREIPADLAGFLSLEPAFALKIIGAWIEGVAGVPAPLDENSNSGVTYPEVSIPMETLSANHQN